MARSVLLPAACLCLGLARPLAAATILYAPCDSLDGWQVRSVGVAQAEVVQDAKGRRAVRLAARRGSLYLTRVLDLEQARGCQLTVKCSARWEGIVPGPQTVHTAKIHLAVATPAGVLHFSARFADTAAWHQEGFRADVPKDAQQVRLNLGLDTCTGTVLFDELTVRNDRRGVRPLDLAHACNAAHGQLGLDAFPKGTVTWGDVRFQLPSRGQADGPDCIRLRGEGHGDWPGSVAAPIPVNSMVTAVCFLHATVGKGAARPTPCAIWTATFASGRKSHFSVFEGRQIGSVGQTTDCENWTVAWRGRGPSGRTIALGATKWLVYGDSPLVSLSCRAYDGAPPVIAAVTIVEEPPAAPIDERDEPNEWEFVE